MEKTQTAKTLEQMVKTSVAKYGYTAVTQSNLVMVYDRKGRLAGSVNTDGTIDRKYDGKQALMGALVRDSIKAAIKAAQ